MPNTHKLIIETGNLGFGFDAEHRVLKKLNLKVEKGSIYGFLGPNGAGKTTTIRLLLGLLNDRGKAIQLFGKGLSANRLEIFSKIGSLIEQPSLYEHLSGYDNLEIIRQLRKISKKRLEDILELVKLSDAADKKVKAYSLGMKQRLGLAIALIGEPELLILDEPVNGLDPGGMAEIRELLKTINKEYGTTIFLSSHLLFEIEKMVSHIGIINMGELLFQGTIADFRSLQTSEPELLLDTSNNTAAFELLRYKFNVSENEHSLKIICKSKKEVAEIIRLVIEHDIDIYEAANNSKNIEGIFLKITKDYTVS